MVSDSSFYKKWLSQTFSSDCCSEAQYRILPMIFRIPIEHESGLNLCTSEENRLLAQSP